MYVYIHINILLDTYAVLTSSSFKGPVAGKPRATLSVCVPTSLGSSSSISLSFKNFFLIFSHFASSLHSKPDVEFSNLYFSHDGNDQLNVLCPPNEA